MVVGRGTRRLKWRRCGEGVDELDVRLGGGEAADRTCESARMVRGLIGQY
jgi:hypothetical protein